jgi:hypothetical protein
MERTACASQSKLFRVVRMLARASMTLDIDPARRERRASTVTVSVAKTSRRQAIDQSRRAVSR